MIFCSAGLNFKFDECSWREKANTLLQDVELLRKARDEDAEIIRQYKDSAERYQTEIVFLKTKVQNTEVYLFAVFEHKLAIFQSKMQISH